MTKTLWNLNPDGTLFLDLHPGQQRAWDSPQRFIAILAGTQGGKTSFLPWWLWREVQTTARVGESNDYLAVTATYDLFKLKFLPAMRECFEHVLRRGRYWASDRIIELADPATGRYLARRADDPMWGRIILRSAESGGGLESSTARAAILDEAGMDSFTLETWEAVLRRLSLSQGRVLIGTTLYRVTGWLKTHVHDRRAIDPDIDVIQFDSTQNPAFPKAEAARARRSMSTFRYNMQYRGLYDRPAGLIYDSFKDYIADQRGAPGHLCPRFELPKEWQRYCGLDFGGVNTAALLFAEEPGTKRLYLYREYKAGGKTAREHAQAILAGEPMVPFCVGGSKSEGQWRLEFRRGGLPVNEPDISLVDVGIDRVYGAFKRSEIIIFDDCTGVLEELRSYSRKLDEDGEPTEAIEDKSSYHLLDSMRYIIGRIRIAA